tara:strand:- start:1 stop:189 length:189 start_codon:yes stop_codon:yes gene_type:complete
MKIGDLVKINCDNAYLHGKVGIVMLNEKKRSPVYGLCVMIDGVVYGFERKEVDNFICKILLF